MAITSPSSPRCSQPGRPQTRCVNNARRWCGNHSPRFLYPSSLGVRELETKGSHCEWIYNKNTIMRKGTPLKHVYYPREVSGVVTAYIPQHPCMVCLPIHLFCLPLHLQVVHSPASYKGVTTMIPQIYLSFISCLRNALFRNKQVVNETLYTAIQTLFLASFTQRGQFSLKKKHAQHHPFSGSDWDDPNKHHLGMWISPTPNLPNIVAKWQVKMEFVFFVSASLKATRIVPSWWFQPIWKILVKMGIFPR